MSKPRSAMGPATVGGDRRSMSECPSPELGLIVNSPIKAPVLSGPEPVLMPTPPLARTRNWFWLDDVKSRAWLSAQTKVPLSVAGTLARFPAAKLRVASAALLNPPGIVAPSPLAVFVFPPPMVDAAPEAVLATPPATTADAAEVPTPSLLPAWLPRPP